MAELISEKAKKAAQVDVANHAEVLRHLRRELATMADVDQVQKALEEIQEGLVRNRDYTASLFGDLFDEVNGNRLTSEALKRIDEAILQADRAPGNWSHGRRLWGLENSIKRERNWRRFSLTAITGLFALEVIRVIAWAVGA